MNAAAVSTAVDDVETSWSRGTARTRYHRSLQIRTYGAFLDSLRLIQCIPGVLSTVIDRLGTAYCLWISRSLLVTNIWVGCLNIWHQSKTGKDVMRNGTL